MEAQAVDGGYYQPWNGNSNMFTFFPIVYIFIFVVPLHLIVHQPLSMHVFYRKLFIIYI